MGGFEEAIRESSPRSFFGSYSCLRRNDQTGEALMRVRPLVAVAMAVSLTAAACTSNESNATTAVASAAATTQPLVTAPPAAVTPTTVARPTATTSTTAEPSDEVQAAFDRALAVKDSFFIAFNSGDAEAVMAVFTADARLVGNFGVADRDAFEELLVWDIAQGTRYTPSNCIPTQGPSAGLVTVTCPFKTHDSLMLAVGAPPVPFTMRMEIGEEGAVSYTTSFTDPKFTTVSIPFEKWMNEHHPNETAAASFGTWTSTEEAETNGNIRAHYATEWAGYLEANSCTYLDDC
jgi:hypothetical protein